MKGIIGLVCRMSHLVTILIMVAGLTMGIASFAIGNKVSACGDIS